MTSVDLYGSFLALSAKERSGVDYAIRLIDRHTSFAIIAPHGGGIELATSMIAEALAGDDHSFYAFEGIKRADNKNLHLTSHKFDEPTAISLLANTPYALAIHGRANSGDNSTIWLGGLNGGLIKQLAVALENAGFRAATSGHALPGKDPMNICNRSRSGLGVQLEIPLDLRISLQSDEEMLERLCQAIRQVLQSE